MSMTDNIFDVRASLKGKQEVELFNEITEYLGELEGEVAYYRKVHARIRDGFKAIKTLTSD